MVAIIGRKIATTGLPGAQAAPRSGAQAAPRSGVGDAFTRIAATLADPLTPAIKREQLTTLNRKNQSAFDVGDAIEAARHSGNVDPYAVFSAAARGGQDAANTGMYLAGLYGNVHGARDQRTTNALVGAGRSYGGTYHGVQDTHANQRAITAMNNQTRMAIADRTPATVLRDGVPTVVPQSEAYGHPASVPLTHQQGAFAARSMAQPGGVTALSPAEQKFIGAQPSGGSLYAYETPEGRRGTTQTGQTDLHSGEALPQGTRVIRLEGPNAEGITDSAKTQLLKQRVATGQAVAAIDRLDQALAAPNADQAVGWIGQGARALNDIRAQYEAAVRMIAPGASTAAQEANQPEVRSLLDDVMRNPALVTTAQRLGIQATELRSQITNLAYMISKANDPSGRMSDQDIQRAVEIISGSSGDPQAMRVVLQGLRTQLIQNQGIYEDEVQRMRGGSAFGGMRSWAPGERPIDQPPAAPQTRQPIRIDAEGNLLP